MTANIIVFHCPSCESKLQVPSQMAGVTGPCPECRATITAPAATAEATPGVTPGVTPSPRLSVKPRATPIRTKAFSDQKPPHTPQATPQIDQQGAEALRPNPPSKTNAMDQVITEQNESPETQQVPQQVVTPFGNQAGHVDSEKRETPRPLSQAADLDNGQRPLAARWLAVILPLCFLAVACLLILAILQLTGVYNLKDSLGSGKPPNTHPESTSENTPETPLEPSGISTPEPGKQEPEATKPEELTSSVNKTPAKQEKSLESKTPAPAASELTPEPTPQKLQKDDAAATPASPPKTTSKTASKPLPKDNATEPVKAGFDANQNLENFLKATTLNERLALMSKSKLSAEELKTSSLAGELKPVKSIHLMKIVPRAEDNMIQHLYSVSFEDPEEERQRLRILMQLVERPGIHPPLVHADAFLEHYEKQLAQYAKQPSKGITTLHCSAEARTSDLAKELPEELKKSMVRLAIKSHPYDGTIFNAYLHKKSPLMEHIGSNKDFPYTTARFCVLSFLWNTTDPDHPYIELKDIVALTWEK